LEIYIAQYHASISIVLDALISAKLLP